MTLKYYPKFLIIPVIIILIFHTNGFTQEIEKISNKNLKEKEHIKSLKMKSLTEWGFNYKFGEVVNIGKKIRHLEYDKNGNEIEASIYDTIGVIVGKINNSYNASECLIEKQYRNSDRLLSKITCKYNSKGNLIESIIYEYDGKINRIARYKYNDKDNLSEIMYYLPNEEIDGKFIYRYNDSNQKIERLEYSSDGNISFKSKYKYDTKGNLVEQICYDRYGDTVEKLMHKYDSSGNKLESAWYEANNMKILFDTFKYDDKNNLIESISYNGINEPEYLIRYFYEYYEK